MLNIFVELTPHLASPKGEGQKVKVLDL